MDKKTAYPNPVTVSLGKTDAEVKRRKESLDELAKVFKVNRSKLFQMIADGRLEVVPSRPRESRTA